MKRFFISFLGAFAALWVTAIIATLGLVVLIAAVAASTKEGSGSGNQKIEKHSALLLDLGVDVVENLTVSPSFSDLLSGGISTPTKLRNIVNAIDAAANDDKIEGLYIQASMGGTGSVGLAQATAIVEAINRFKESGKWVMAYGDFYSQREYLIASTADSLFVNPVGMVEITGLASQQMYFKDFLSKIGVEVQVVRVGTYKSAVEPFMLSGMSEASREQITDYLTAIWTDMTATISKNRKVTPERVNSWADSLSTFQSSDFYLRTRIADGLRYSHEMTARLRALTDVKDADDDPRLVTIDEYCSSSSMSSKPVTGKHIAVLYAEGDITEDGRDGIASETLVPEIQKLTNDEDVQGLILRVNSPGGSAFASEQIWAALEEFKAKTGKPFYVSMGDVAASGGYYISCGAERIYAQPTTITGSIGIFGMIPNVSGLLNDKLGIHTATVSTNPEGLPVSLLTPLTPRQRSHMQAYVNRGYELFTSRCAAGRHMPQDSIKAIAEGRVWAGSTAQRIGLVDKMGGLEMALADMAEATGLEKTQVMYYPKSKYDWMYQLMTLSNNVEERIVARQLGVAYPLYKQISRVGQTSPLQARMEFDVDL